MSAAGSAGAFAFRDLIADLEWLLAAGANAEHHSMERFHAGAHARRAAKEFLLNNVTSNSDQNYCGRNGHPAEAGASNLWQFLFPRKRHAAFARAIFRFAPAGDAVM